MKPKEKKPERIFRIISKKTGDAVGSYSRAYCDEFDFSSPDSARNSNCHGVFEDKEKYAIAEYKVTYTLINPDVDDTIGYGTVNQDSVIIPDSTMILKNVINDILQKAIDNIDQHNDTDAFITGDMSRSEYLAFKRALVLATDLIRQVNG